MVIDLNLYEQIRYMYTVEKLTKREIARRLQISRNTVDKYCSGGCVPWERREYSRSAAVVTEDVAAFIRQCLEDDLREGIKKQQHTAKRIFDRLVTEKDFSGGESTIRRAVNCMRESVRKTYIPLEFAPGDAAQIDWGEATIYLSGVKTAIALFCLRLCYSCTPIVLAFYRQNEESFLEGFVRAFSYLGGVPRRILFDNAKVAVKEGFGLYARKQQRLEALEAHYVFRTEFCNPNAGHEKGLVENLVGWSRRNILVPIPRVDDLAELNNLLAKRCVNYLEHRIRGRDEAVGQQFNSEKSMLLPIPTYQFDTSRSITARVDQFSTVRFDCNNYSVPVSLGGREVSVKGYGNQIIVFAAGREVTSYPRCYQKEKTFYQLEHYLPLLEKRPRAVLDAKPVKTAIPYELLEWAKLLPGGNRDIVRLLHLCADFGVEKILQAKRMLPSPVAPSLALLRSYLIASGPSAPVSDPVKVQTVNLAEYDKLLQRGGSKVCPA